MKLLIKSIVIAIATITAGIAEAHTPVDLTISENAVYSFRFEPGNAATLNNHFVKEMARYNYLNLYRTQYYLDYELEVKISETTTGTFNIESSLNKSRMDGDIFYEKFDLSQVLMPSQYSFELIIENENGSRVVAFSGFDIEKENTARMITRLVNEGSSFKMTIRDVNFYYAEEDKTQFEQRILDINEFLAFYQLLEFNLNKTQRYEIDDTSPLLADYIRIYDLKRFHKLFKNRPDSIRIPDHYQFSQAEMEIQFESQLRRLNHLFERNVKNSATLEEATLSTETQVMLQLQQEYLQAMNSTSHLLEPVYLRVLNFFDTQAGWDDFKSKFIESFSANEADENGRRLAVLLTNRLYEDYIFNAERQMEKQAFIEAVIFLNSAKTLCSNLPEFDCDLYTFHKLSTAKYGIYDSYISVAASAQKAGSTSLAYTYLMMARQFQKNNNNLIITSGVVDKALSRLAWQFVEEGNSQKQAENDAQSLDSFVNAKDIYMLIGEDDHLEYIDKQIARLIPGKTSENY